MLDGKECEMLSFVQDTAAAPVQSLQLEWLHKTRPGSVGISVNGFKSKR